MLVKLCTCSTLVRVLNRIDKNNKTAGFTMCCLVLISIILKLPSQKASGSSRSWKLEIATPSASRRSYHLGSDSDEQLQRAYDNG
jgi:hypothetical protein